MNDSKTALVLHRASGGEPLLFAVDDETAEFLGNRLRLMLEHGSTESITTSDGNTVLIDFHHIAVAYLDDLQRRGKVFGLHG